MRPKLERALSVVFLLGVGCGKVPGKQLAAPSASAAVAAASSASGNGAPSASVPPLLAPTPSCRAIGVQGDARVGDAPLVGGALIDGSAWITLAPGASFTLKYTASGRELGFTGPALVRACRRGREQVLLAKGKVAVGSGMGSRPGSEVLIATPVAGVRYGDADFVLALDDKRLSVEVRAGAVELDSATNRSLKSPLHAKDNWLLPLGKPDPAALLGRCQAAAEAAEASARHVGDRNAPEPLGERAQAHVKARRAARVACTIAAAATGLVEDPAASAALWADAARWEGLWETIPRPQLGRP